MKVILAKNEDGNYICFRSINGDLTDGLMRLLQYRYVEGWYKNSPSTMALAKRLMEAYYNSTPLMVEGEAMIDPDYEGIVLDLFESRNGFAKEIVVILETEN